MRLYPIVLLLFGLSLSSCSDPAEPPPDGTLAVSTSTSGNDPDPDGFDLYIDDSHSLALRPSSRAELALSPGRHTLQLVGVAEHCSVTPGTSVEVDIRAGSTTPVAFQVTCSRTGARITVTTTGLDLDPDGYRAVANGADRGAVPSNGTELINLDPGTQTIALTDMAPNCTIQGPQEYSVSIVGQEIAPVEFTAVCTAVSGVIGVRSQGISGVERFIVLVDGVARMSVTESSGPRYLGGVPPGAHAVSLRPSDGCGADPQTVTVRAGTTIRDTVEVTFSVTCLPAAVRITAPTTGPIPPGDYNVWLCTDHYCDDWSSLVSGRVAPNDTLVLEVRVDTYTAYLSVPSNCVKEQSPPNPIVIASPKTVVDVEFRVACS
jgi:hypothetical protein